MEKERERLARRRKGETACNHTSRPVSSTDIDVKVLKSISIVSFYTPFHVAGLKDTVDDGQGLRSWVVDTLRQ